VSFPVRWSAFKTISTRVPGVTSLITFFLVWFLLKESLAKETRGQTNKKKTSLLGELKGSQSILFYLQLFISLSLSGLEATFAYFAAEKAGIGTVGLGYIFMIM